MKISIIIPVYNEENTIQTVLNKVVSVKLPYGLRKEIIVIDDGSTDKTPVEIKSLQKKIVFKSLRNDNNRGKGFAVRVGIKNSSGELIIIQDADLEYNPKDFSRLISPIIEKNAQVVYGSRFINYPLKLWGKNKTILPSHWVGNKLMTFVTNLLYGSKLTDMETGYKLFKKEALSNIRLTANRFDIEPEITAKLLKKGYKIFEVEIKTNPRTFKEGKKISWRDGIGAILTLFKYRFGD